jgi:hypothetical protein
VAKVPNQRRTVRGAPTPGRYFVEVTAQIRSLDHLQAFSYPRGKVLPTQRRQHLLTLLEAQLEERFIDFLAVSAQFHFS